MPDLFLLDKGTADVNALHNTQSLEFAQYVSGARHRSHKIASAVEVCYAN